ncbi:hypothetical protein BH24ACI1_BH24ACI1_07680 [soil metagenome]
MKLFASFLLIVGTFVCGIWLATNSTQGQQEQVEQPDEPTVVKKGQITKQEKAYSKEYEKEYDYSNDPKLTEIKEPGGIGIVIGEGSFPGSTDDTAITSNQFLEKLSCEADAVVVGKVKDKASHLTSDERFIYTAYDFEIKRTIKNNPASSIEIGKNIEITRPGGFIKIDDQLIKVEDKSYEPLKRNKEYLLFLKFVPSANGYKVFDSQSDFALENNAIIKLSKRALPKELKNGTKSKILLDLVQNASLVNCSQYLIGDAK